MSDHLVQVKSQLGSTNGELGMWEGAYDKKCGDCFLAFYDLPSSMEKCDLSTLKYIKTSLLLLEVSLSRSRA